MKVVHGLEELVGPVGNSVLTIGNFDGVHQAHQKILAQAGQLAAKTGGRVVALTFEPHPLTVVRPEDAPRRLTLLDQKLRYMEEAGAATVVVARSEPELLALQPHRFVTEVITALFRPTAIVEGPTFCFGRGRKGTPQTLRELATPLGCDVHIVDPVRATIAEGETVMVSSTLIRDLLRQGRVREASLCLGRGYALCGEVVRGDGRGRRIGFPTANLSVGDQLVPAEGVYAGRVSVGGRELLCAISVGHTPTFGGTTDRAEAHILDFDADIYGELICIEFERFLRPQCRFDSPDALVAQLRRDVEAVRSATKESRPTGADAREGVV